MPPLSLDTSNMQSLALDATRLLKSLAHPARLLICCELRAGERAVGDLEIALGIKQPNLSRELAKLRAEGVLKTRRVSKVVFYHLASTDVRRLIDALCNIMTDPDRALAPDLEEEIA